MLALEQPKSQGELTQISNRLNQQLMGLNAEQIRARLASTSSSDFEVGVLLSVSSMMQQIDRRTSREVYRDGLMDILRQPEFAQIDRMQALLETLEHRQFLEEMLTDLAPEHGVQVVIGGELHHEEMSEYSMVLARYGMQEASGIISVLGPLRMPYAQTVGVVRYVARLLDDLVARMYGT
jgi:heat-inducible transcriptional repressor